MLAAIPHTIAAPFTLLSLIAFRRDVIITLLRDAIKDAAEPYDMLR